MSALRHRPAYLKPTNALFRLLSRCGIRLGVINILTVTGRSSGQPRSTPVSPVTVGGRRFVLAPLPQTSWARNARIQPSATLARGRTREPVRLAEVQDAAVVRQVMTAFPTQVPHGVRLFVALGLVTSGSPDEFAAAAPAVTAFEVLPA